VTQQQYDKAETEYNATLARYEQLTHQRNSTKLVKQEQKQRLGQNDAMVQVTEAALNLARLNLSYTIIVATADGVCGRLNIHEGQLVQPGQTLVDIVDDGEIWVIANYKETQTANIEVGMPVTIKVDAVLDVVYNGRVEAISQATGASYSLFKQDNSAGNFIKIEQRIPIRISFDKNNSAEDMRRLRSGLNVECEIDY
jgi:membrane fusion protein (multidrug efflux system)